jgi:hypothetical protein
VLKVHREQQAEHLILTLSGEVIESIDFASVIGPTSAKTTLICKDVSRINSRGIRDWIEFFQKEITQGTHLHFVDCSPAVVEQMSLISNFACGGTIHSIYVPFSCPGCNKHSTVLYQVPDLKTVDLDRLSTICQHCGSIAVFDDIPAEYFLFLNRQSVP